MRTAISLCKGVITALLCLVVVPAVALASVLINFKAIVLLGCGKFKITWE